MSRIAKVGVVGALLLISGASLYLAFVSPAYWAPDEAAHVGYVLRVRDGDLPSIDTTIPNGDEILRRSRDMPTRRSFIYVANGPPHLYLLALPFTELTTRLGSPAGPLLGMRLFNIMAAAGAVCVTFLLGRELGGRDEFVGLVTAGLVAGTISFAQISSLAHVDAPALLATTGVTLMLARYARGRTERHALWLGMWAAAAAAVRPMSLVYAGGACAMALFLGWRAHGARQLLPLVLRLAAPTALIAGWFYVLNMFRYGDFTASSALFEKLGRAEGSSLASALTGPLSHAFPVIATEVYGGTFILLRDNMRDYAISALGVALVLGAIVLAFVSARREIEARRVPTIVPAAWVCSAILSVVPVLLTAQHISGGGNAHPRYLFPMLPIVAVAAALLATRVSRWLAVALVVGFVVAELTRLRAAANVQELGPWFLPPLLRDARISQPYVGLAVVLAVLGAGLLIVALVRLATAGVADSRTLSLLRGSHRSSTPMQASAHLALEDRQPLP